MDDLLIADIGAKRRPLYGLRRRLSSRRGLKQERRQRSIKMNSLPQHVCVVRSADPVFCAHGAHEFISSLGGSASAFNQYWDDDGRNLDVQEEKPDGTPLLQHVLSDEAVDGVAITTDGLTRGPVEETHSLYASTQQPNLEIINRDHNVTESSSLIPAVAQSLPGHHHSQSTLSSQREQEYDQTPPLQHVYDDLEGVSTASQRAQSPDLESADDAAMFFSSTQWSESAQETSIASPYDTNARRSSLDLRDVHRLAFRLDSLRNQDTWPVDDPRREYGVADFIDTWTLCTRYSSEYYPGLPVMNSWADNMLLKWRPPSLTVGQATASTDLLEIQGIDWTALGTTAQSALQARSLLHPSRRGVNADHSPSPWIMDSRDVPSHFRFRSYRPGYRPAYTHFQLRNTLAAFDRNNIIFVQGSKLVQTSLAFPSMHNNILDLSNRPKVSSDFRITCIAALPLSQPFDAASTTDPILLAGGFHGEYAMLNLNTNESHQGYLTHAYNGLVTHIHAFANRISGQPQAALCSNDSKIRLLDIATTTLTSAFAFDYAINASATSRDGRLRAVVGDADQILVTDAEKGETLVTLREHTDHGFAVAWAPDGVHLATAAQDGKVIVWDARNWTRPLHRFASRMSCARSLQFTERGKLVAAESEDVVSIYDFKDRVWLGSERCLRTQVGLADRQDIRFFGAVAGVALLDGGEEMVVGNADKDVGGLLAFEAQPQGYGRGTFGKQVGYGGAGSGVRSVSEQAFFMNDEGMCI